MKKNIRKLAKRYFKKLLLQADIIIDGERPWDIQVNNSNFYQRVLVQGSLGLGESYVDNYWDCSALDQFIFKILHNDLQRKTVANLPALYNKIKSCMINNQSSNRAFQVGEEHYDIGNYLFELILDENMVYSCGYWKHADSLSEAQLAKLDMICRKLRLSPGMRLLDIGCGWGGLLHYAARHYGVEGIGVTVSKEQAKVAQKRCSDFPVEIYLQDYREVKGSFDAVASVGMLEHVGYKNYSRFMEVVNRCLKENGLFLLQTIASNRTQSSCDPWFDKYIFPNGMLPSIAQIGSAIEEVFIMEDWHNLGVDYDKTLMGWYRNFEANREKVKTKYSERFFRMWRYYLLSMAGGFRARHMQTWQIVLSSMGNVQEYTSVRCPDCTSSETLHSPSAS